MLDVYGIEHFLM